MSSEVGNGENHFICFFLTLIFLWLKFLYKTAPNSPFILDIQLATCIVLQSGNRDLGFTPPLALSC